MEPQGTRRKLTRRRLLALASAGALAGAASVGLYTWRIEPHWIEIVQRELPVRGLPAGLVDKRVVQISDLHIGNQVDSNYIRAAFQRISSLNPDCTLITGDFMTARHGEQIDEVVSLLKTLQPGPLGCFAIFGNHDYGSRWSDVATADELANRLQDLNIRVLRNSVESVAGLQLVGLDDLWSPRFRPDPFLFQIDWDRPTITLCHNPDAVDLRVFDVCKGWILAGHTHGGQCKPPFLPPPLLPVKNRRYTSGEFELDFGRMLYINRGLGYLRRVRFNARPEITLFKLKRV